MFQLIKTLQKIWAEHGEFDYGPDQEVGDVEYREATLLDEENE